MAKEIDKIIQSKTAPKSNNVLWDDGENLKINRNGKWENANNAETNSLSIDPVVWKYIMNPCIIKKGEKIPDDLLDENNKLKYDMHPNMYRVWTDGHGYLSIGGPSDIIDGHGNGVLEECAPGYDVWFSVDGYWDNEV